MKYELLYDYFSKDSKDSKLKREIVSADSSDNAVKKLLSKCAKEGKFVKAVLSCDFVEF